MNIRTLILVCCMIFILFSCRVLQYGTNFPTESSFTKINSGFNNIDSFKISKSDFILKYGNPVTQLMEQNGSIEKLYYLEKLKSAVISWVFTFEQGILKESKIINIGENFQPYLDSIRWEIRIKK